MARNGELFKAPKKSFEEIIFFVHFYGGSKKALQRHIQWVNSLGFDAFAFDFEKRSWIFDFPIASDLNPGWKNLYADQVEAYLNDLPGKKIVYSFSNPTVSVIQAMARRFCSDTVALICDSGPSAKFVSSVANLVTRDKKYIWPLNLATATLMSFFWSPKFQYDLSQDLSHFPKGFPILSIRGWKDPLIPPDHIDLVFEPHSHLEWQKLSLPEAEHLNGLRDYPDEYKPQVLKFLKQVATPIKS